MKKLERCSGLPLAKYTARVAARLQKADRVPLALGRFSRRGAVPACENRSAAPNTAPCFIHRMRSLCLPLLRFGCFCRRQRLSCAASFTSLFLPQAALGSAAPCGGALNQKLLLLTEPPHIVRTVQKRGLQGVEQANQRLAWRSESGARPVFVWSRSWL